MAESSTVAGMPSLDVHIHGVVGTFQLRAKFRSQGLATAVFGQSGAGKTSLIQMLAGLKTPHAGHIRIGDTVVFDSKEGINLPVEERRVGMVFQDSRLFPHMSVERNLTYSHWAGGRLPGLRFDKVIELLSLEGFLKRNPLTLSGGEQQRVAIGRALLSDPRILLLDEPLASLDNARKQNILPFIERVAQESRIPVCYVSHSMDEVTRIADELVVLSRGKTIASGPLTEILTRVDLGGATGRHEAGAIVSATVVGHDDALGLTQLMLQTEPPLQFELARCDLPIGAGVRLRIRARDVSIAIQPVAGLSIRNQLPARIETVKTDDKGYAELVLRLGADGAGAGLRARITAASAQELQLDQGDLVFALVKSIAIERRLLQPMIDVAASAGPAAGPEVGPDPAKPDVGRLDVVPQRNEAVDRQLATGLAAEFLVAETIEEEPVEQAKPDAVQEASSTPATQNEPIEDAIGLADTASNETDAVAPDVSVSIEPEIHSVANPPVEEVTEIEQDPVAEPEPDTGEEAEIKPEIETDVEEEAEEPVSDPAPNPFLMDAPAKKR